MKKIRKRLRCYLSLILAPILLYSLFSFPVSAKAESGTMSYLNIPILVITYNQNAPDTAARDLLAIKNSLETGRLFVWRNSKLSLNLKFTYLEIPGGRPEADNEWTALKLIAGKLQNRGILASDFSVYVEISDYRKNQGSAWTYGLTPEGSWFFGKGFIHLDSPMPDYGLMAYPQTDNLPQNIDRNLTFLFLHEFQHILDAMYEKSGHPEMWDGDKKLPWLNNYMNLTAAAFRNFSAWKDLNPKFAVMTTTKDLDLDGVPDRDPGAPLDELRFGSNPRKYDSDNDQFNDFQEMTAGAFASANPVKKDTDGDGIIDGEDDYPLDPISNRIVKSKGRMNWQLVARKQYPNSASAHLYSYWDGKNLYFRVTETIPRVIESSMAIATLYLDLKYNGWNGGEDDYKITLNLWDHRSSISSPDNRMIKVQFQSYDDNKTGYLIRDAVVIISLDKLNFQQLGPIGAKIFFGGETYKYPDLLGSYEFIKLWLS